MRRLIDEVQKLFNAFSDICEGRRGVVLVMFFAAMSIAMFVIGRITVFRDINPCYRNPYTGLTYCIEGQFSCDEKKPIIEPIKRKARPEVSK